VKEQKGTRREEVERERKRRDHIQIIVVIVRALCVSRRSRGG